MGSAAQSITAARRVGPAFLGFALAAGIFAWGALSGSVPIPARFHASDVSVGNHPLAFWAVEAFWLLAALAAGLHGVREVDHVCRGVAPELRRGRHGGLPESLNELVRTHSVPRESVPRLLAELRPSLRPSDYYPMLHHRVFEWMGVAGGLLFFGGMFATLTLEPWLSKAFVIAAFGMAAIAFVSVTFAIPASMRRRRHEQMERVFAAETLYAETRQAPAPLPMRVPRLELIDSGKRELRCTSPDGRYVIYVHPQELHMRHRVFTPEMIDSATREPLFHPRDSAWSLDAVVWQTPSLVSMRLLRFPGDHAPIGATFDCASRAAHIDGVAVEPFTNTAQMEIALKEAYEAGRTAAGAHPASGSV
jgi:hypothetical protein